MSAIVTLAALPVAALVLWTLLRSRAAERLVAVPTGERWHDRATPTFGGVGIFAGFAASVLVAVAADAVEPSAELLGVLGGCALLFAAGIVDDLRPLGPVLKLATQLAAAGIVLASGLSVEIVGNDVLATAIAVVWLVGITNAFNLLDNMDGLAAALAAIACAYYALDAVIGPTDEIVLVVALALGFGLVGFLPFNLRPGRSAAVFMGDSGSQVLGFALGSLALLSSWKTAGTTLATTVLPLLVLAIPILDTALVTTVRLVERRPVSQGGRDHTSHRLVYYGLSEGRAVALLALLAAMLGATGLAYNELGSGRVTTIGVLLSFIMLVQFASYLSDLEERARSGDEPKATLRGLFVQPRRLIELLVDFTLICGSFFAAYLLQVEGQGTDYQKSIFLSALPILVGVRYLCFVLFGVYRRVWRFASIQDWVALAAGVVVSAPVALALLWLWRPLGEFPHEIFVVDALLCLVLVGASRLALRMVLRRRTARTAERRRVLVVGAGRTGRSVARELQETAGTRVVGFVDDNPAVRRRRIQGVAVAGALAETARWIEATRADEVVVTIPNAEPAQLEAVVAACEAAGIPCRIHRRESSVDPRTLAQTAAE